MAKRGGKRRAYATKSGSFVGTRRTKKTQRGKPVSRISNRQHRQLGTLQSKRRAAAYRPRRPKRR